VSAAAWAAHCLLGSRPVLRLTSLVLAIAVLSGCAHVTPVYDLPEITLGDPSFYPTVEAYTRAPILPGNRVELLLNGDELFPAMLAAVRGARTTITLVQYVYEKRGIADEFTSALAERCRAGLGVNVLLDAAGSFLIPGEYVDRMRRSGCHVAFFRPLRPWEIRLNYRTHRRILVIDGRVAFTGGFGISEQWTGNGRQPGRWRDTGVRVEGPAVRDPQGAFAQDWREATGVLLGGPAYLPPLEPVGGVAAEVVSSSPLGGSFEAYTLFLLAIDAARRSIDITNPYFVPDARMSATIIAAVHRGVRVRVLVPAVIDHPWVREASRRQFGPMLRAGVEIHEYLPALLHSKTVAIDGVWATVGSTNFDNRSFALNEEVNLTVYDRGCARRLEQTFEDDLRYARPVTYQAWKHRGLLTRVREIVTLPIRSQM
jgi:cardiolipin synthase A/B